MNMSGKDSKNGLSIYDLGSIKRPALHGTFQIPQGVKYARPSSQF
jgi:hypothetical protein